MQLCPNCAYSNREGEMFCSKCGIALGAISVSTKQLDDDQSDLGAGGTHLSNDKVILLHFVGYDDPVALQIDREIVLGREGASTDTIIGFNLEPFGAVNSGVSRRHAILSRDGMQLFIRDIGSTNHTFLNGDQLAVDHNYALRDGDELTLGRLQLKLFFK